MRARLSAVQLPLLRPPREPCVPLLGHAMGLRLAAEMCSCRGPQDLGGAEQAQQLVQQLLALQLESHGTVPVLFICVHLSVSVELGSGPLGPQPPHTLGALHPTLFSQCPLARTRTHPLRRKTED